MKQTFLLIFALFIFHKGYSQNTKCIVRADKAVTEAGKCLNEIFSSNNVDKQQFKNSFENCFLNTGLVKSNLSKGELYMDILRVLDENPNYLPYVKSAPYVAKTANALGITIPELIKYKHLDCYAKQYERYKILCPEDTVSNLYVFGGVVEALQQIPQLHYSLVASTIRTFTKAADYELERNQDFIVFLFWFQTAGRYGED